MAEGWLGAAPVGSPGPSPRVARRGSPWGKTSAAKARLRQGRQRPQAPSRELFHFFTPPILSAKVGRGCTYNFKKKSKKINLIALPQRDGARQSPCLVPPSSAAGEPRRRSLGAANKRCLTSVLRVLLLGTGLDVGMQGHPPPPRQAGISLQTPQMLCSWRAASSRCLRKLGQCTSTSPFGVLIYFLMHYLKKKKIKIKNALWGSWPAAPPGGCPAPGGPALSPSTGRCIPPVRARGGSSPSPRLPESALFFFFQAGAN